MNIVEIITDKNNRLETDKCLVFNTYKNIQIKTLMKTLDNVSNIVNRTLNEKRINARIRTKQDREKYMSAETCVKFLDFYQYAYNNVHSHSYLSVPDCYDKEVVFRLVKDVFERIDKNHKCFLENANHILKLADYSSRYFDKNNLESYRYH